MARKQHKTARGAKFDMDQFTNNKDDTLALGNLGGGRPTNAKGDILGQSGKVEVKREEAVRRFYREELPKTSRTPISNEGMATAAPTVGAPGEIVKSDTVFQTPDAAFNELEKAAASKTETKTTRRRRD